jgi:hypothetical protein
MSPIRFLVVVLCATVLAVSVRSGERTPGKYSGVVVFDRWGGCTLYSGVYVMYVSERVKEKLRPYDGKAVRIDAKGVDQPMNPGDGLITDLTYLGEAPEPSASGWFHLSGLSLRATPSFKDGEKPSIVISVKNTGKDEATVHGSELAPTLLMKCKKPFVADGPSHAILTRQAFIVGDEPRKDGRGWIENEPYSWQIDEAVPKSFVLKSGEERRVRITFDLPPGEYDFLAGYGGGVHESKCLASNRVSFDVTDAGGKRVLTERD